MLKYDEVLLDEHEENPDVASEAIIWLIRLLEDVSEHVTWRKNIC